MTRLTLNLLGFALLAAPLVWLVQRRAGPGHAARCAVALAAFAFFPTHLAAGEAPKTEMWRPDSVFRWSVGWPNEQWVLRHDIDLTPDEASAPARLIVRHAGSYQGSAVIRARVNGRDVGPLREDAPTYLSVLLPLEALSGQTQLSIELRQEPVDPALRVLAHNWPAGATRGSSASSYFDGMRWRQGTFNELAGGAQQGAYLVELGAG